MKKILFIMVSLFWIITSYGQYYVGHTVSSVKLRHDPTTQYKEITTLPPNAILFIDINSSYNGFYHVVNVKTNQEGYVFSSYVAIDQQVESGDGSQIVSTGRGSSYNAELTVYNNTNLNMTLKVGEAVYKFRPQEKKYVSITPGSKVYRASAPGVIPCVGTKYFSSYEEFEWEFYVVTSYSRY